MSAEQLNRIDRRLALMEKMLRQVLAEVPEAKKTRITEKEVIAEYGVSKHVLRRLRMGYLRGDGVRISPMLFKWGHRNGRSFDYDREEVDTILRRQTI